MPNSDKPAVVRRPRRGRSVPDSKHKTDSGCFVDEELERNGSSDSSSSSLNSSPLREEPQKVGHPVEEKKAESGTASSPEKPSIVEDCSSKSNNDYDKAKQAMDEEDGNLLNTLVDHNAAATENSRTVCNAIEKSRQASDFYCLYYSASPEGTLTRSGKGKLNSKPPVPPKPKLRRGSAPPLSFNNVENLQQRNKEVKKRSAYNGCQNSRPKSDTIVNLFRASQDLKFVGERILYFETFGQSASSEFEIEHAACNDTTQDVEDTDQLKTSGDEISEQETLSKIQEEGVPLVKEEASLVEFSSPDLSENDTRVTAPLVEPEESLVDDSRSLSQHFLESINKIDETLSFPSVFTHTNVVDSPMFEVEQSTAVLARGQGDQTGIFNENSDGKTKQHVQGEECGVAVEQTSRGKPREAPEIISLEPKKHSSASLLNDTESFYEPNNSEMASENSLKEQEVTGAKLQLNSKGIDILRFLCSPAEVSLDETVPANHCHNYQSHVERKKQKDPKDHWLNSHLDEIKKEGVQNSESFVGSGSQHGVGSFCGLPHLEKDVSSQLKRRSWSACDGKPKANDSLFARKVYQTTSSRQPESGLSSPLVRTLHSYEAKQSSLPDVAAISKRNVFERKIGQRQFESLGPSRYASDDSNVHSEWLFQPLKRNPRSSNSANFIRSVSDECVISELSATESDMPCFTSVHQRRLQHSMERRDPINALQRQSIEFADEAPSPPFRPISPVQVPPLKTLRRSLSNTSSSSDSEVEKIFKQAETPIISQIPRVTHGIHNGIVRAGNRPKISAMEALFGPQTSNNSMPGFDCSTQRRKTLSGRFSEVQPHLQKDEFESEEFESEEFELEEFESEEFESEEFELEEIDSDKSVNVEDSMLKGIDEPGLEFDDTDYSEFYTLCEDKESLITAEALSIKKLLKSPQTVLADSDIQSVVLSATERRAFSPSFSEDHDESRNTQASPRISSDQIASDAYFPEETSSELEGSVIFEKRNRGTQTPPPEVFRALSPPPSVGTQTPPLSLVERLSPYFMYKASSPSSVRSLSPPLSQPQVEQLDNIPSSHFGTALPTNVSFSEPDLPLSLQEGNKAISVEELLHILANMQVGQPAQMPPPSRRSVSIQRYNNSILRNTIGSQAPQSLPSSWQHLNQSDSKQDGGLNLQPSSRHMQWSSRSHDCIRRSLNARENRDVIQAKMVGFRESNENIRKKLREWKLRTRLFEEEVECMEDKETKEKRGKVKAKVALKVSYDGSESTDNIETQSKLTKTHSLKRPRKDRAFSQKEKEQHNSETTSYVETYEQSNSIKFQRPNQGDKTASGEDTQFDITPNTSLAEIPCNGNERSVVDTPVGINVFIDYRKKNGQHIMCTSTPKPSTEPGYSFFDKEGGVGNPYTLLRDKPVGSGIAEDFQTDVECQGDASSSSYSSDDDPFGEFGGSTETVVFVDTEPSLEISLTPDPTIQDSFELKLVETPNETGVYENGKDCNDSDSNFDALLGEARRSLNLEVLDANILDKAIERFKQRVSPKSQNNAPSSSLSMEASVALHQADQLQGIISEIKGELKLLQDENVMLREQVESLANHQTAGEVTENSSTESSERLEHAHRLSKPQHGGETDEDGPVEVDVCLRGFSPASLLHIHSKKRDILLGTVSVKGADWNGVIEAARKTFVEHMARIDPENYLCVGPHSIQGVQTGVIVWSPGSLRRNSPRVALSQKSNPCVIELKDGSHFSCDSLVYDTLLPKEVIEKYVEELLENRCIVLCGQQGLGKSYLAARLGEHIVQRIGWKRSPAVLTLNVAETTRKELKQELFMLLQCGVTSPREGTPAVIILDQLNCLASLADIFELSQLKDNKTCPYIIGVRDKSRKGPFSSKELALCQYFRWLRVSIHDRQYVGLLGRFLRRKLSWSEVQMDEEVGPLLELFDWLSKLWYHLNEILEDFCEPDSAIGPSLFFSCPMDFKAAEGWFGVVWNYHVIPYLHQALRAGRKIFSRYISWEDPTKWVLLRYPWNKDQSRVLPTLRKLRQVDIVLNRNQLGSDNVSFAECIEDNERILRAHSTMSKRVRRIVEEKIPKGQLNAKRKVATERGNRSDDDDDDDDDRDSCYSETDSYLETSI